MIPSFEVRSRASVREKLALNYKCLIVSSLVQVLLIVWVDHIV